MIYVFPYLPVLEFHKLTDLNPSTPSVQDNATKAAGFYTGNFNYSGTLVPGTTKITKVNDTTVTFDLTISGQTLPTLPGVKVSAGSNESVILQLDETDSYMDGTVVSKTLSYSMTSAVAPITFTGTKP